MAHRIEAIMQMCCEVFADEEIQVAVKGSAMGGAVAGGMAVVGGLLLGPAGIAAGGALGGLMGAMMTHEQFKPVPLIISELSPPQQERLYKHLMVVLERVRWTDVAQLIALVLANPSVKQQLKDALVKYISKEV
ncbi:protein C19orf12 homolog [Toxotes jaculatrix]|uniref:protein C19orf12 homolog n=1 Tax=Toxotes jaculatrix TaxID=941984 RepID=UPI001B3AFFEE|nr:protein C19orf12 homolog [Toxotes jaculatrix]